MRLEPGMRVRCVDAGGCSALDVGCEYDVLAGKALRHPSLTTITGGRISSKWGANYYASRFKPIVRVKARCVPSLDLMLRRAVAAVKAMTPAERAEMQRKQAESWARNCVQEPGL